MTDIALPLRTTTSGELATVEKHTPSYAAQQAVLVCATRPGEVPGEPGYGLYDQRGRAGGPDLGEIESQLERWVPDVDDTVATDPTTLDRALALVDVKLKVRVSDQ